jgi:antitoxin (DNA-binding transcriptional repressor) of toxin-antitoxin stability system
MGYFLWMKSAGIRELRDNLNRYIRRIEAGERIAITANGRVVAELVPPGARSSSSSSRFDELVGSGVIRPPDEDGDPTQGWPDIRLPAGTAAELIDADRGDAQRQSANVQRDGVGVRYIESSALVAALLERDAAALKSVRTRGRKVTSSLTIAETARWHQASSIKHWSPSAPRHPFVNASSRLSSTFPTIVHAIVSGSLPVS